MDGGELIGLVAVCLIFGPGILAVWSAHKRKMAELELQKQQQGNQKILEQIEALRRELGELRRTSTEFDMSVDANLQHLQQRITFLEGRIEQLETRQHV